MFLQIFLELGRLQQLPEVPQSLGGQQGVGRIFLGHCLTSQQRRLFLGAEVRAFLERLRPSQSLGRLRNNNNQVNNL
jgi:hypothetical protein